MDISSAALNFDLLTPQLALIAFASVILLFGSLIKSRVIMAYVGLLGLVVAFILNLQQWNSPATGFFGMVTVDNFSVFCNIIFLTASIIALLMSRNYLIAKGIEKFEYYAMILFSTIGMMTMASSSDLVVIFLGLEIMSVPLYVLAGMAKKDPASNESSIKYFIMGAFATGFLLYGIALIYGVAETTDLRRIMTDFAFIQSKSQLLLYSGAFLILIGFGFKIAAVPFHMWVPDVYQGAPTPVTGFFSVAPKAAGVAALLRIFVYGFPEIAELTTVLWILAVLTMTAGNLLALMQKNIKRMLAYSSIAHAGYILVALTAGGEGAVSAALYYLLAYTFFNLGGFAIVTMIDSRKGSKALISEMKGLSGSSPFLAALLALFMFALSGFPPTAGFFGKFYLFSQAIDKGFVTLVIIAVLNSFVSVYYYLNIIVVAYFKKPEEEFSPVSFRPAIVLALIITAAGTLAIGLFPDYWLGLAKATAFPF